MYGHSGRSGSVICPLLDSARRSRQSEASLNALHPLSLDALHRPPVEPAAHAAARRPLQAHSVVVDAPFPRSGASQRCRMGKPPSVHRACAARAVQRRVRRCRRQRRRHARQGRDVCVRGQGVQALRAGDAERRAVCAALRTERLERRRIHPDRRVLYILLHPPRVLRPSGQARAWFRDGREGSPCDREEACFKI